MSSVFANSDKETGHGEYRLEYEAPEDVDSVHLDIKMNGVPIAGSPFSCHVKSRIDPDNCTASGK